MKKNILFAAILAFLAISCQGTKSGNNDKNETQTNAENKSEQPAQISELLAPKEFLAKYESKEGAQLVDVRTPEEVAEGALEGAANIDFNAPDFTDKLSKLDKEKPLFLYCRSGGRSGNAARISKEMGFKEVYDMQGGWLRYSSEK